ncbi:TPA: hypothetical protein O7X39_004480 [Salmonella enterica]|nr:hypothetical protein [Salmonella enterica]
MTTISFPQYVVVSKSISRFEITHDIKDKNVNILISIIYDMINGSAIEHYLDKQEEAENKYIEKNSFSKKFKARINNIPPEEIHPTRNTPNPK